MVVIADSRMVNYVYLLKTGIDLWTSADIIESAYNDPSKFYETLREVELNNDISVEIFGPADNIVYRPHTTARTYLCRSRKMTR